MLTLNEQQQAAVPTPEGKLQGRRWCPWGLGRAGGWRRGLLVGVGVVMEGSSHAPEARAGRKQEVNVGPHFPLTLTSPINQTQVETRWREVWKVEFVRGPPGGRQAEWDLGTRKGVRNGD